VLPVSRKLAHTHSTITRNNEVRDTRKQNQEQSSCNKMHNVLACYHFHEARVYSHHANHSFCHLPVLSPPCNDDPNYILPPFPVVCFTIHVAPQAFPPSKPRKKI
jgi:hypothetical protein